MKGLRGFVRDHFRAAPVRKRRRRITENRSLAVAALSPASRRRGTAARRRTSIGARPWWRLSRPNRPAPLICLLLVSHVCMVALGACALHPVAARISADRPGAELARRGDEIVVCGRLFHTGTRVVLWTDPGGYDAYRAQRRFSRSGLGDPTRVLPSKPVEGANTPMRYSPMRDGVSNDIAARVQERGWSLADLQAVVDQFVIHYDVAGTSRRCFEVLHDERGLSVHFMLDVDGTIYQTLDLKERARHAAGANDRSVGVEIAQMGAYEKPDPLARWYRCDAAGRVCLVLPPDWRPFDCGAGFQPAGRDGGVQPAGRMPAPQIPRPARPEPIRGRINGIDLVQYDFTPQQYDALARLTATLARMFPRLRLDAPRDSTGHVRDSALADHELARYRGLLGHYHVTNNKSDPGPAFDWERVLDQARRLLNGVP